MSTPLDSRPTSAWLEGLKTERLGQVHELHAELPSTMDRARELGTPGLLVVADAQTAGRGTHGRTWESPAGRDLYLSFVWQPEVSPRQLPSITLAVGLAIAELVEAHVPETARVQIRWPNDVMVGGRKIAGVLVESRVGAGSGDAPRLVVGIGLNVNREHFPAELEGTSLQLASGAPLPRDAILRELLTRLEDRLRAWEREGSALVARDISPRLRHHGEEVVIDEVRGRLRGVDVDGALLVEPTGAAPVRVLAGRPIPVEDA